MEYPFRTIQINNREVSLNHIANDSAEAFSDFERNTFHFIAAWLNGQNEFQLRTSGSTGPPKLITIHRHQMLASARLTKQALHLKKNYTALLCLETEFIAGKMMIVRSFVTGMKIIATEPAANPLKAIPENQPINFAAFVPYQLYDIVRSEEKEKLNNINTVIIGGSSVDEETLHLISTCTCSIFATYGMTETISHIALRPLNGKNSSACYQTLPGISIRQDERECLVIRAPYLPDDVYTNDIVEVLSDSQFQWSARWDNVINSGGLKIFPEQLEASIQLMFQRLKLSNRFFISSQHDDQLGSKVVLYIESKKLPDALLATIHATLKQDLPKHHQPKSIFTVPQFPLTKSGKIDKRAVENSLHQL